MIKKYQSLHQVADISADHLNEVITQVLADNPDAVDKYKAGKKQVIGFLIGQSMQQFKQKVDAQEVKQALEVALKD